MDMEFLLTHIEVFLIRRQRRYILFGRKGVKNWKTKDNNGRKHQAMKLNRTNSAREQQRRDFEKKSYYMIKDNKKQSFEGIGSKYFLSDLVEKGIRSRKIKANNTIKRYN